VRRAAGLAVALALAATIAAPAVGQEAEPPAPEPAPPTAGEPPAPAPPAAEEPASEPAPAELAARHVLVTWKGSRASAEVERTKEEALERANEALVRLREGADFAELAREMSDDRGSAARGGFLGIFERGSMVKPFQDAVEALEPGQLDGPAESEFGWHVVQRLSVADAMALLRETTATLRVGVLPFAGAQNTPAGAPSKEEAREKAAAAVVRVREGARPEELTEDFGLLPLQQGWTPVNLSKGTTVPAFQALEDAGFALAVGDVAEPVESPVGFLVAKRLAWFRARVEHLLVMHTGAPRVPPDVTREPEEARARAEEALARLAKGEITWKQAVATYSDEPGAAARQGSLGVVVPGTMVPEFDAAIAELAPGERSAVVESRFGFHILRRLAD